MIGARRFAELAAEHGYRWFSGVPCSYLGPLLAHLEAEAGERCVTAANEGDAVAIGAGTALAGQPALVFMQNSGLGNAVNPLSSLSWPFRIPLLLLVSQRGEPGVADEPQHELMGAITSPLLELLRIPWEYLPESDAGLAHSFERAAQFIKSSARPYALVARQRSFAPGSGARGASRVLRPLRVAAVCESRATTLGASERPTRREVLERLIAHTPPARSALLATTGYTGRELYALCDRPNQLYLVGSMGCAGSLGLGISLARPDLEVVVAEGDGALLMRMGALAAIGARAGARFTHVVLDNEAHESTGAQATAGAQPSFAAVAAACGYAWVGESETLQGFEQQLREAAAAPGPRLLHVRLRLGSPGGLPRPHAPPDELCARFVRQLATSAGAGATARGDAR